MQIRGARKGLFCSLGCSEVLETPLSLYTQLPSSREEWWGATWDTGQCILKLFELLHQMKIPGLNWIYLFSYSTLCGWDRSGRSELTKDKTLSPPHPSLNVVWINLWPYETFLKHVKFSFYLLWFSPIHGAISTRGGVDWQLTFPCCFFLFSLEESSLCII